MAVTATFLSALIEDELSAVRDPRVTNHIRSLLVPPGPQKRDWDYGEPDEAYPCWMVLADGSCNTGIAFCESGFGPARPWGLLFLEGQQTSMGMDSGWYDRFLDAYFESMSSTDLRIWRVFQQEGGDFPGVPISAEGTWDATWEVVMRMRSERPQLGFNCWQSVYTRDA